MANLTLLAVLLKSSVQPIKFRNQEILRPPILILPFILPCMMYLINEYVSALITIMSDTGCFFFIMFLVPQVLCKFVLIPVVFILFTIFLEYGGNTISQWLVSFLCLLFKSPCLHSIEKSGKYNSASYL